MRTSTYIRRCVMIVAVLSSIGLAGPGAADAQPLTVAVFDLEADERLNRTARQVTEQMTAGLSAAAELMLVERQRLDEGLREMELGISGTVNPETAARLGRLVGANALVTGRVFRSGGDIVVVARTIGTETGRVFAESATVSVYEPASRLAELLVDRLITRIKVSRGELVAPRDASADPVAHLRERVQGRVLPSVSVSIPERHAGRAGLDPAAETEITRLLLSLGFRVLDPRAPTRPDIEITGEAFSEVGLRRGSLVTSRGRVELKAVDRLTRAIVAADRQTEVAVDLSGEIAGKKALQEASAALGDRLVLALLGARAHERRASGRKQVERDGKRRVSAMLVAGSSCCTRMQRWQLPAVSPAHAAAFRFGPGSRLSGFPSRSHRRAADRDDARLPDWGVDRRVARTTDRAPRGRRVIAAPFQRCRCSSANPSALLSLGPAEHRSEATAALIATGVRLSRHHGEEPER